MLQHFLAPMNTRKALAQVMLVVFTWVVLFIYLFFYVSVYGWGRLSWWPEGWLQPVVMQACDYIGAILPG